ncbi:MAG: hypothetical protein ABFS05_13375, partial [Bacteroidota bacterium]
MPGYINYILSVLFVLFGITALYSQDVVHVPKPKAEKAFERALKFYHNRESDKAEKELIKSIRHDSLYVEPYLLLADIYYDRSDLKMALKYYDNAIVLDPGHSATVYLLAAKASLEEGLYQKAVQRLTKYLSFEGLRDDQRKRAEDMLLVASFREDAMNNPVPFKPLNLGARINSPHDEFVNSITLNESQLVFTLMQPDTSLKGHFTEGFVMAVKKDTSWELAGKALPDLYELGNIGAMSLSPDGRFLFFTSCGAPIGFGSCDLYVCGKEGEGWSDPQNLGDVVNTPNWDSQPCFSADGQTLYFSSARPGGKGGSDIWHTTFKQGEGWSKPLNEGANINTKEEEMAPFIHADGQTMYFSSKGHMGMGGFDLFISRQDSSGQWQAAENLGWPVNTASDEI